jgi:hypothetical protein
LAADTYRKEVWFFSSHFPQQYAQILTFVLCSLAGNKFQWLNVFNNFPNTNFGSIGLLYFSICVYRPSSLATLFPRTIHYVRLCRTVVDFFLLREAFFLAWMNIGTKTVPFNLFSAYSQLRRRAFHVLLLHICHTGVPRAKVKHVHYDYYHRGVMKRTGGVNLHFFLVLLPF